MYRPKSMNELRTPAELLIPAYQQGTPPVSTTYNGVAGPVYPASGLLIYINFKSYRGTESAVNGIISVIDTALVTTWYRPDIKANCRIKLASGEIYEIISDPENVELQNKYLTFKVEKVKGY